MQFDIPIAFGFSENKDAASSELSGHKSSINIAIRYVLFLLITNFTIFYRLLTYQRD
jgi:hypothetical protein